MQITSHGEKVNTNVMNVAKKGICEEIVQTDRIAEQQTTSRMGGKAKAQAEAKAEADTAEEDKDVDKDVDADEEISEIVNVSIVIHQDIR